MKFSDLTTQLNTDNKTLRAVIADLGLDISPKARIIPDEHIPAIKKALKNTSAEETPAKKEKKKAAPKKPATKKAAPKKAAAKPKKETEKEAVVEKEAPLKKEKESSKKDAKKKTNKPEAPKKPKPSEEEIDLEIEEPLLDDELSEEDLADLEELKIAQEMQKEIRRSEKKQKKHKEDEHKEESKIKAGQTIEIPEVITVKEFGEKLGIPAAKVIGELLKNGMVVTINHKIDYDTAMLVASEFGIETKKILKDFSSEDLMSGNVENLLKQEDPSALQDRPAIISVMGHVDHGKTSLLDYIRDAKVVEGEAGGITQHIGAYQVKHNGKLITFLDTPGHEAFTHMRARGAKATDIAILVVAADEGVKPQTIEAINHAKEAGIPIIVAMNKMDKEGANIDKLMSGIAEHGLVPEAWGGDVPMVPVSAKTGQGVDQLLEIVLLISEMADLKANPDRQAIGTVLEAHLDQSLGPVASILVNTGTLNLMDNVVVGEVYGRVKVMYDHNMKRIKHAKPSTPVLIAGLSETPHTGDILQVEQDEKTARERSITIKTLRESKSFNEGVGLDFNQLIARINEGKIKQLKVVLKADTKGSLEAIINSLAKINTEEVQVQVIHSGIGNITDTDILMASASQGMVIGFQVETAPQVARLSEKMRVTIKHYRVIYQILEEMKALLSGLLDPEIREVHLGDMKILAVFFTGKKDMIVGGKVLKGKVKNKSKVRVIRADKLVGEGEVTHVKKGTETVNEVAEGHECGIRFQGNCAIEEGDLLELFITEKVERTLD